MDRERAITRRKAGTGRVLARPAGLYLRHPRDADLRNEYAKSEKRNSFCGGIRANDRCAKGRLYQAIRPRDSLIADSATDCRGANTLQKDHEPWPRQAPHWEGCGAN